MVVNPLSTINCSIFVLALLLSYVFTGKLENYNQNVTETVYEKYAR